MRLIGDEGLREKGVRYSRPHRWRLIRAGLFPRPVKLSGGRNLWIESEVDAWINARIAERDAGEKANVNPATLSL